MNEQEFIHKIKSLKQIKPDDGWISLTKSQILSQTQPTQEKQERVSIISVFRYMFRPMTLAPVALSFVIGLFLLGQISLPGDTLRPIKTITETTQETFIVKQENKSEFYLDLAGKRADELKEIVETNQTKKLSSGIKECEASIKKATESLVEAIKEPEPEQVVVIVQKVAELKQITQEIENSGVEVGEIKELEQITLGYLEQGIETTENKISVLTAQQIQDFENRSLNEEQKVIFQEAEQLYEDGSYAEALKKIFLLSQ